MPSEPRIPRRRPTVMYQEWRHLLFLHWAVPVDVIRPHLPRGIDVDTFDGDAYLGLVPFTMQGVRPRFLPSVRWLSNFHETNVRTYVRYRGRPGVWFFSLDAANPVGTALGRALFGLPYHLARMCLDVENCEDGEIGLSYVSERRTEEGEPKAVFETRARVSGPVRTAAAGSLDHFLVERYTFFATSRGGLRAGDVRHAPYPIQAAEIDSLDETLIAALGIERPSRPPLALYASGVRVEILGLSTA